MYRNWQIWVKHVTKPASPSVKKTRLSQHCNSFSGFTFYIKNEERKGINLCLFIVCLHYSGNWVSNFLSRYSEHLQYSIIVTKTGCCKKQIPGSLARFFCYCFFNYSYTTLAGLEKTGNGEKRTFMASTMYTWPQLCCWKNIADSHVLCIWCKINF